MTGLDAIKRALRMLGVLGEGETPSGDAAADALAMLNGMLGAWENEGLRLGLPEVTLAGTIPLPSTHHDAIAYNLAVALAAEWHTDVRPAVATRAEQTKAALQAVYADTGQVVLDPVFWAYRR